MNANGVPSRSELLHLLTCVQLDMKWADPNLLEADVRLQVVSGGHFVHWGDPSFDVDHRGAWGASSISPGYETEDMEQLADDLISQVEDMLAENSEED